MLFVVPDPVRYVMSIVGSSATVVMVGSSGRRDENGIWLIEKAHEAVA